MSTQPSLPFRLLNKLMGILSVSLALFCLYLVCTQVAEKMMSKHLVKRLQSIGMETQDVLIKWSGRGLCAHSLHIKAPQYRLVAQADQICTRLSFTSRWPFLSANDILIIDPQLWVTANSDRTSFNKVRRNPNAWTKLEDLLSQIDRKSKNMTDTWGVINLLLTKLKDHKVTVKGGVLHNNKAKPNILYSAKSLFFDAQINALGGTFLVNSPQLNQSISLQLTPRNLQLNSPIFIKLKDKTLKIKAGAKLTLSPQLKHFSGQIEWAPKSSKPSLINVELKSHRSTQKPSLTSLTGRFQLDDQRFLSLLIQQSKSHIQEIKAQFNNLDFQSLTPPMLSLMDRWHIWHTFPQVFNSINGQLNGEFTLNRYRLSSRLRMHFPTIKLPSLPILSWPTIELEGSLTLPSDFFSSQDQKPQKRYSRWQLPSLMLTLFDQKGNAVKAELSTDIKILHDAHNLSLEWASLTLNIRQTTCQSLFGLIPKTLTGPIYDVTLKGKVSPSFAVSFKRKERDADPTFKLKIKGLLRRCRFESMALTLSPQVKVRKSGRLLKVNGVDWLNKRFSFELDRSFTEGHKVIVGPETKSYIPLDELPSHVGGAMYLTEETGFWRGGAFSLSLLNKAINTNIRKGQFVYGGSTITQQLVKNLFLHREKTLTRKVREALISAQVIDTVSKRRVLELYLNMIEFGPKVFGIQAAAQFYFQKDARLLSPEESIFLAMLKVSPKRGARWIKRGYSPKFTWWKQRTVQIFDRLVKEGLVSSQRAKGAAPFILRWADRKYLGYSKIP
jgi:hypothetical protein